MKKFSLKHLLTLLMGIFLLTSCGEEMDRDLPMVSSRKLEGSTWVARASSQGTLNDGTAYYALTFTSPSRYTWMRLDAAGMPKSTRETGTFTIVRNRLGLLLRLYPYNSRNEGSYVGGIHFDEVQGEIIDQGTVYRRRP